MKHSILPVTLLMALGCSDANSRTNTCGGEIQANASNEVLKNPLDLGAGLGGYLRMNAESADKTPAFCNAFPQYNSQTKSYLVFTAVHCFGSNNVPAGEFYLSQKLGYMRADAKELYREKLRTIIAENKSFGPKTKAIFNDKFGRTDKQPSVDTCLAMSEALPPEILKQYSIACFSGADLRVAHNALNLRK